MGAWIANDVEKREEKRDEAWDAHIGYWADKGVENHNEDLYKQGFEQGWDKANNMRIAGESDPEEGVQEFAKGQREPYGIPLGEEPDNHWEWEHGFWMGMQKAYEEGRWEEDHQEEEQPAEEE